MEKFLAILSIWVGLTVIPIFAAWTIGLPVNEEWFWFGNVEIAIIIFWAWFSLFFALKIILDEEMKDD